jgi:predicted PurR-regulated permease PerM
MHNTPRLDPTAQANQAQFAAGATGVPTATRPAASVALTILASIAFIAALKWAQEFFIPLVFGILVSYTLSPMVGWLIKHKLPRLLATGIVMSILCASTALVATSVYMQAQSIVDDLPLAAYKLSNAYKRIDTGGLGTLDKVRIATEALKEAASPAEVAESSDAKDETKPAPVVVKAAEFDLNDWLWAGSLSVAAFLGQMTMVLFLVFFALLSGDTFKRKLVRLTGPSLSHKKITVNILEDINQSIQKYMLMLLVTNIFLGFITWLLLESIDLDNAGAWATAAALLHIIPYFGSLIASLTIALAAFLQFESFSMMFLAGGLVLGAATLVGMLVATWMTGRIAKMNATAVFVTLLFGTWLWGVWGMLLCVPIIVVVKVVSSHVEGLSPIAELLGE